MARRQVTLKFSYTIGEEEAVRKAMDAYTGPMQINPDVIDVYIEDKIIHVVIEHDEF